ncbi:MAG: hypothetical protein HYT87_20295 [Nitrospirae bacterium]|nr:hypothetical protein [Nitrospirota bacterium]
MKAVRLVFLITLHSSLITISPACQKTAAKEEPQAPRDTQAPTLSITEPSLPYGMEGISQREGVITFSGMAEDDQGVVRVKWENHRGGKGWARVMNIHGTQTNWEVKDIPIEPGDNKITLTAQDAAANAATKTIWVGRTTDVDFISYPDASETDIHLNEATETIFRVAIKEARKVKIESVKLVKVNENGEILDTLGPMYDDGKSEHGDEVPADGVYSARVTLLEGTEGMVRFRVVVNGVKEGTGTVSASSEPFGAQVFVPLTDEELKVYLAMGRKAGEMYAPLEAEVGGREAARRTAEWLKKQPGVKDAGSFEDGYSFVMDSGLQTVYINPDRFTKQDIDPADLEPLREEPPSDSNAPPVMPSRPKKLEPLIYKTHRRSGPSRAQIINPKVLVVSPYSNQSPRLPAGAYDRVHRMFADHKCPVYEAKRVKGALPDVEVFKTLKEHDTVILDTHGEAFCPTDGWYQACPSGSSRKPRAFVATYTGTRVTASNVNQYRDDLRNGMLYLAPLDREALNMHFVLSPTFVTTHNSKFRSGTMVFNGSCRSMYNPTMAGAFLMAGASYYMGYNEYVRTCYDSAVVKTFFESLLAGSTAGQAFTAATTAHGFDDNNCWFSPLFSKPFPAVLTPAGNPDLKITIEGVNNGSFEQGPGAPPPGWDAKGDVQIITKLGPITAKEGLYMAYLSTGENAEEQPRSMLEQPFCVPPDAKKVSFDYRLVSEEPDEFLNSGYRDTFEAALVVGSARTVLVSEHTDQAPWNPVSGIDLEGGDRTAFATDWRRVSGDLSETARAEGATLAFRLQDNGDLVYDTAALLENVHLE